MKIRIVNLDFYMSNSIPGLDIQYSEFRGSSVYHVPVIRIYGSTEEGEKICLHVHGVFPYIYIPYDGQIGVDGFMYQIALGLDKAINISLGQASSNTQHVYKVCLISGIPFYGYHARQHQYLKIYFYNPLIIKKACTLLQNGNILGKIYQPHEAHIPYILQFMIDYNLHGMSFINVSDLKYRADDYITRKYPENTVLPPSVRKMSVCKIEADTKTECILNREEITPGRLAVNPGIKALWDDEKQRRRNNRESSQMEQFLTQNRIDKPQTSTHIAYKKMLDEKLRLKPKLTGISPELELSVYPAETPPDSNLLNASTIDVSSSQNTDDSIIITNESILDEDGRELYDLLRDLKEDNIEKDSVLSQVQKEDESDGENDIDLSLPLDVNLRTPRKIEEIPEIEFLNDSYFETLGKLPQLDGVCDDLDAQPRKRKIKKNKTDGKNNIKAENLKDWDLGLDNDYFLNLIPNKENIKDKSYYLGNTCEMRKRSSKKTFKVKTSAIFCKSKLKFAKIQCNYCFKSHPKTQRCIKSYFRKDEEEQINDVIGKICQDINAEELKWEKRLDIGKVVEDICQNLTIEKRSKSKKLSKKLSCSYCPSDKQKQHDVVIVDTNQNLLTETSASDGKKGLNENKSNKRGRRKKTVKKVVETTIIEENFNLDPHEEKITVKNGIKPLHCVLGKVKRSRKKKNLINDDKTNRQLDLSLSDKDSPIPGIKIRKNCIKKTSQASTPLNMPSLCDSNECNNIDDIEDNNNNINTVNLNNAASAECLLASEQPNLAPQQGRYNLRSRKPKPPKPPADLPKIPIEKSKTKSKPKRPKQSKNKQTQTLNLSAKSKRKPATKPLFNIIVTKTQKIDSYNIKVCPIKKDGKPCDYYELGPNPKPKFRVIAGKKPYTFNVKNTSAKYPNTTWSSYYKPQNLESNSIKNDDNNSIKIISNQILENGEKYCETEIKKGAIIDTMKIEPKKLDRLTSQEEKAVDALTELYDEIQGEIFPQIDVPEIFESLKIGDETTDGAPSASITSSNSLSNYREDMKRTYDNLMEKMGRSLNDLFDNISPVRRSSRIQKDLSRKKDAETKQKNVSFNDVCSVRSYHSESLYLFDDDEMEMIDDKAPAPSKSERKPLISLDRQAPIKQKMLPSELGKVPTSMKSYKIPKLVRKPLIPLEKQVVSSVEISSNLEFEAKSSQVSNQQNSKISPNTAIISGSPPIRSAKNSTPRSKSLTKKVKPIFANPTEFKEAKDNNPKSVDFARASLIKRYRNLQRLLSIVSENSEPINYKMDIDYRVVNCKLMMQKLQQQLLDLSRSRNSDPHLHRCNCMNADFNQIKLRTVNVAANYRTFNPDLNLLKQYSDLNNYVPDSDKSKDGLSVASRTNKARKRKTKKKNTKENKLIYPVNQYASLDGPNDSSSDDDQPVRPAAKRRCIQPRKPLSESLKYSPLKVHYGSPTKSTDLQKQVNRSPISFTDEDKKETSKKFKRKLSFSRKTFNKTQSEEKLTCVYRSNKKTSLNIVSIPTPIPESTINMTQNESNLSLITPYQKPRQTSTALIDTTTAEKENEKLSLSLITPYQREQVGDETFPEDDREDPTNNGLDLGLLVPTIQTLEPSNCASTAWEVETNVSDGRREQSGVSLITPYQKVDVKFIQNYDREFSDSSASLSDDIFSPNLPNSSEIFTFDDEPNGDRDPAKLYDVLNNYIPQAGTSKLTGSSVGSVTPKQLSSNSIETIASADNRSSENDVITPYQKEIAPLSVFEFANRNHRTGPVSIIPKIPPPSRKLIEDNLRDYDIPEVHHKEAFYSNAKDVTGPVEIGVKVLRILSDKIGDLPEFESSFKGIDYYRREYLEQIYPDDKITIKDINNYKKSFCKISNCVIRTAELPPTKGEVKIWLKNKLESDKEKSTRIIEKKKRILIPCSPGNDQDDDSDDSLTISPCTPLDETLKNVPQQDESPVIKRNEALKRYRKRKSQIHSSEDSSGKSLELTKEKRHDSCQITGVTLDDLATSCDNLQKARAVSEYLNLTVFCMELIVETRNNYNPDPSHDVIKGIIYKIFNDVPEDDPLRKRSLRGCFLLDNMNTSPTKGKFSILDGIIIDDDDVIKIVKSEAELITQFVQFFIEIDPDILIGYEIEMLSWGYLIERGYVLNLNLISLLSRVPISTKNKPEDDQADLTIPGRIILDFWRLLRHEIALQSYTFENIVYHILHQRAPLYSFKTLTNWWNHTSGLYRNKVLRYYYYRIDAILKIIERLDLIGRTSELAKLFGIQFFEVLSRGSQFRVESMMLRLAKPLNYIAVSPNVQQRARMRAPESLPLIMEPESKFYVDPVIVLDFQSLYPSMIIAYNYCFSTCLGRIEHLGQNIPFEFGATHLKIPRKYVKNLSRKDLINISPCGVGYVKKTVREGILPKMLQEILDTRLMVKKSLKKNSGNKILERVLDARQLGLKLIANVTYGYTAANFSGRMPCIEVGDSVVSKGRETLQRAINLVEKTAEWGARVVYGDTDSLFVLIPGRSRQEAFRIGAKIAEAVTEDNPSPVKLKLEKIFHPCILQTKKRYVGYMFESPDQVEPEYCAKGIETVRRDGCPAVSKMLEKCLKILFDTRDVSLVRQYVVRQFSKILTGRISIQDLTFAKEYRGASNYRPGACVPALELARKWIAADKRSEPRRKERVPYVIVNGPPGLPLIKLVRSPRELIADPSLRPNALYYITKVIIPPINRCFLLIGADVNNWFNDMPRKQYTSYQHNSSPVKGKKSTISQYFSTRNCAICAKQSKDGLCDSCLLKPQSTSAVLHEKIRVLEQNYFCIKKICELCCCTSDKVMCISLDCPVYYKRVQINKEIEQTPFFRELIAMLPSLDF